MWKRPNANEARTKCAGLTRRSMVESPGLARATRSGLLQKLERRQRGGTVIEADLLDDLAVDNLQHGGAGEVHLAASGSGEAADQEVVEGRSGVGPAAFPLTDDIVALGDQVRSAPEVEVGERR